MKKCLSILVVLAVATVANAALVTTWEEQSAPAGMTSWKMMVATDTDWTNSRMEVDLTDGSINYLLNVFPAGPVPQPLGLDDTAGFGPGFAAPTYADWSEAPQAFRCSWGNSVAGETGDLWIGILTMSDDADGEVRTWDFNADLAGVGKWTNYPIVDGEIVPEPATLAVLGLGGLAVLLRKKR